MLYCRQVVQQEFAPVTIATPEPPEEFFVCVTTENDILLHNISLGVITSASVLRATQEPEVYFRQQDQWLPFVPNPEYRTALSSQFLRTVVNYQVEYEAERVRCLSFRHLPSRLGCIFAWGSLNEAQVARETFAGRFRDAPILRCLPNGTFLRLTRCNSAIIPMARHAQERGIFLDQESSEGVWRTYWSGSDQPVALERNGMSGRAIRATSGNTPRWEWLIDGSLRIVESVD